MQTDAFVLYEIRAVTLQRGRTPERRIRRAGARPGRLKQKPDSPQATGELRVTGRLSGITAPAQKSSPPSELPAKQVIGLPSRAVPQLFRVALGLQVKI